MIASYWAASLSVLQFVQSARILGVIPTPSYSHQVVFRPLWNELSRRGHEVVVITTNPQNNPDLNITEIDVSVAYEVWEKFEVVQTMSGYNVLQLFQTMVLTISELFTREILHPDVQRLLKNKTERFDLVIMEYATPIIVPFTVRFDCPYIGVISMPLLNLVHDLLGNPSHPVLYPDIYLGFVGELSFWERFVSVAVAKISEIFMHIVLHAIETPAMKAFLKEQFGHEIPPLTEVAKNVSMVFINEDPACSVRPVGPAFVRFGGGSHLTPPKPLPKDLEQYLDSAKEGCIYFSLGTNVKSNVFLPEQRKVVLDAFRQLPYKVLWKFDIADIPDLPENVKIFNWLPQQDVLRHPNVKAFITQGGFQSTEEAIFRHVPIVGIPYFGDQTENVKKVVLKGGGVFLDKHMLTTESLQEALLEVINNPKYKENMKQIAELSRDQPMTGLEKMVWWTEYVIRHKGARHFRNPAIDIPFYQYYFLDVIAFTLTVLSIVLLIFYKVIAFTKKIVMTIFKSRTKVKDQ